jgi:hypothetical protein
MTCLKRARSIPQSLLAHEEIAHIRNDYAELVENRDAEILSVTRIIRKELESPYLLKNADFTPRTVRELIWQGEETASEQSGMINR